MFLLFAGTLRDMDVPFLLLLLFLLQILCPFSSANVLDTLRHGSSLSVEAPNDILVSENGVFSAGFFRVGENAFCFSIWFTKSKEPTVVWMANRDNPVNGKASKFKLLKNGNIILRDAGRITVWRTETFSSSHVQLKLMNNGNIVLRNEESFVLWQSFDSPTDTLLPGQALTEKAILISSRSTTNYSSGFYKLYFDNDNVLRLLFDSPNLTSAYWPAPWRLAKNVDRSTYNISRTAVLDSYGYFKSSDEFESFAVDYGALRHRRLTVDPDGNARLYSFNEKNPTWEVSWLALSQACRVDGICGPNSMCTYDSVVGRSCYCVPGYKIKKPSDWTQGCEPEFAPPSARSCNHSKFNLGFFRLPNMEFYGYDIAIYPVSSLKECQEICLDLCDNCKGFQIKPNTVGGYDCYPKTLLLNGRDTPNFVGDIYLKLPKSTISSYKKPDKHSKLVCLSRELVQLSRTYKNHKQSGFLKFLLWFACGMGGIEMTCIFLVWFFLFRASKRTDITEQRCLLPSTGFEKFTYDELKKATGGFSEEIGRGPGGTVYKGKLYDDRIAAIKHLDEAKQGEAEFLAEISTIGRLNHMNLIEMWGYCVHGKHTLLVYEYMEHGSLAENLSSNELDWKKRFNIDVGTAKGLAYLHEECLEWVLHCDVKPQNILLDSSYQPKVADFGLSKLLNRNDQENSNFSRIRGTRGYMAPEWVYNLRITSKVDVYSYGIVVLEMVTGKSPTGILNLGSNGDGEQGRLVIWVNEVATKESWIEEIVDPMMDGKYNIAEVELLVKVAMQCVKDDKDARPTMRQAVEKLLSLEEIE